MANRGVHFAISPEQAKRLGQAKGDEDLMNVIDKLEEDWDTDNVGESDKAWDAIHRCLTDGRLEFGNGAYPFSHCILGPRQLHRRKSYVVSLVLPWEVQDIAQALAAVTPEWFGHRYSTVVPRDYAPEYGQADLDYTWAWFQDVRELYRKAAERGKAVIFTVDR